MADTRSRTVDRTESAPVPASKRLPKAGYLIVLSGSRLGELHALPEGKTLVIGRGEAAEIRLVDDGISRRHASICCSGAQAKIEDLGSHNGTFIDGQRLTAVTLEDGGRVELGFGTLLKFAYTDELEAEMQRKLAADAVREPLTGLYNRRLFEDRLAAALAAAKRHGRAVAVLMIDVDHFKHVNDRHGHLAGDQILQRIGAALQGELRTDDLVARIGGDEFAVLAETDARGAQRVAETLRAAVARLDLAHAPDGAAVTVSVGAAVSTGKPNAERGHGPEELMEAADRAMYGAKQAGRDQVRVDVVGPPAP